MAYKIFISYSSYDFQLISHVKKLLKSSAIKVYVAEYSMAPGDVLSDTLKASIKACDLFLLIWSRKSQESTCLSQEFGIASSWQKPIVPVVLDPGIKLPIFIENRNYLAAYQDPETTLELLKSNIFENAKKKEKANGLMWLMIGGALLWLLYHR